MGTRELREWDGRWSELSVAPAFTTCPASPAPTWRIPSTARSARPPTRYWSAALADATSSSCRATAAATACRPRRSTTAPISTSLKRAGVTDLVAVSAVGSFRDDLPPGRFVLVDQFIDRTVRRENSFFGPGVVGHVGFGHPVSPGLVERLAAAAKAEGIDVAVGGTYVCIEGPHFSTLAESRFYRAAGCDVIGMTNVTEAKLAREAELPFATIAMVTDFDCWHPDHDHVDVAQVVRVMHDNAVHARQLVARFVADFPPEHPPCPIGSDHALDTAVMTAPAARDPAVVAKLDAVAGRVLAS